MHACESKWESLEFIFQCFTTLDAWSKSMMYSTTEHLVATFIMQSLKYHQTPSQWFTAVNRMCTFFICKSYARLHMYIWSKSYWLYMLLNLPMNFDFICGPICMSFYTYPWSLKGIACLCYCAGYFVYLSASVLVHSLSLRNLIVKSHLLPR